MLIEARILASFSIRALAELAESALTHAASLALGARFPQRLLRQQLLRAGLREITSDTNGLSPAQKVVIADWLLPLQEEAALPAPAPSAPSPLVLTLDKLAARLRRSPLVEALPDQLTITGRVAGDLPPGTQLLLLRDNQLLRRVTAETGPYQFVDHEPGTSYRVELSNTGLSQEQVRELVSPVLFGVRPHGLENTGRLQLAAIYPGFSGQVGRFSFTAFRQRMYLLVPVELGAVVQITQPNDNNADITVGFSQRPVTVDFGLDGLASYVELENSTNYIGDFTLDAHLAASAVLV